MNKNQEQNIIDLLWDCLPKEPGVKDRRHTGWGTKTKVGLIACIERIVNEPNQLPTSQSTHSVPGQTKHDRE